MGFEPTPPKRLVLYSPILETFYLHKIRTNLQINQINYLCQNVTGVNIWILFLVGQIFSSKTAAYPIGATYCIPLMA